MEYPDKEESSLAETIAVWAGVGVFLSSCYAIWFWGFGGWAIFLGLLAGVLLGVVAYRIVSAGITLIYREYRKDGLGSVVVVFLVLGGVIGFNGYVFGPWIYDKAQDSLSINKSSSTSPSSIVEAKPRCDGEDPLLKIWPSVVKITAKTPQGPVQGSGFVVDSSKGYILTANHVVAESYRNSLEVTFRGQAPMEATQEAKYGSADIALIRTGDIQSPSLIFAPSSSETTVFAVGYVDDTYARIPNRINDRVLDNAGWTNLVTDGGAEGGMSGGPLVNTCGELVGIITDAVSSSRATDGIVAVAINRPIVEKLIAFADE